MTLLNRHDNVIPISGHEDWLCNLGDTEMTARSLPIDLLLNASVYYPASGFDGHPVQCLSPRLQSFVYVDYSMTRNQLVEALNKVETRFTGYDMTFHRQVLAEELGIHSWRQLWSRGMFAQPLEDVFCEWLILSRSAGLDSTHGPRRFSMLYLNAEGLKVYRHLYRARQIAPRVLCLIQPAMNIHDFRSESGPLGSMVLDKKYEQPSFLVSGGRGLGWDHSLWPVAYPDCVAYLRRERGDGLWARPGIIAGSSGIGYRVDRDLGQPEPLLCH